MITQIILTNLVAYLLFQAWQVVVACKDTLRYQRIIRREWFAKLDTVWSCVTAVTLTGLVIGIIWS